MRTANKYIFLMGFAALGLCLVMTQAHAQSPSSVAMRGIPSAASSSPMPKIAVPVAGSVMAANEVIPPPPMPVMKREGKESEQDIKIPDSVKSVIKHLGTSTENITIDDLNTAREAIARLDVLIDIEKRLSDLEKIREEREKKSMASAIPASALAPPPPSMVSMAPMSVSRASSPAPVAYTPAQASPADVAYIQGSNGHYSALVKVGGDSRLVHAGEHMADGTVILAVTPQSVELEKNGTKRLLQVKGVQTVFRD